MSDPFNSLSSRPRPPRASSKPAAPAKEEPASPNSVIRFGLPSPSPSMHGFDMYNAPSGVMTPSSLLSKLETMLVAKSEEIQLAGRLGESLLSQQAELERRIAELESEVQPEEDQVQDAAGDVGEHVKTKLQALENEMRQWDVDNEFLYQQVGHQQQSGTMSRSTSSNMGFDDDLKSAQASRRAKRDQLSNSRANDIEFATEIGQSLLVEVRRLQALLTERDEYIGNMARDADALQASLESRDLALKSVEEANDRYKEENWNLEISLQEITKNHAELVSTCSKAETDRARLAKSLASIKIETESQKSEIDRLNAVVEDMQSKKELDMAEMRKGLAGLQREKSDLQSALEKVNGELARSVAKRSISGQIAKSKSGNAILASPLQGEILSAEEELLADEEASHLEDDVFGVPPTSVGRRKTGEGLATIQSHPDDFYSSEGEGQTPDGSPAVQRDRSRFLDSVTKDHNDLRTKLAHAQKTINTLKHALTREKAKKGGSAPANLDDLESDEAPSPAKRSIMGTSRRGRGRRGAFRGGVRSNLGNETVEWQDEEGAEADSSVIDHGDEEHLQLEDEEDERQNAAILAMGGRPQTRFTPSLASMEGIDPAFANLSVMGEGQTLPGMDSPSSIHKSTRPMSAMFNSTSSIPDILKGLTDMDAVDEKSDLVDTACQTDPVEPEVRIETQIKEVDRIVHVPQIQIQEKIVERIVEVPKIEERIIEVEKIVQVPVIEERIVEKEKIVEVPQVQYVDKIVERIIEVPKIEERIVEVEKRIEVPVTHIEEKVVHVPRVEIQERVVEKIVEVPRIEERIVEVQVEKIIYVPQIEEKLVEKIVEVPKVEERIVEKIVEVVRTEERIIEVPVERLVEKLVEIQLPPIVQERVVEKIVEVPVIQERVLEKVVEVPRIKEKIVEVEKIVYLPAPTPDRSDTNTQTSPIKRAANMPPTNSRSVSAASSNWRDSQSMMTAEEGFATGRDTDTETDFEDARETIGLRTPAMTLTPTQSVLEFHSMREDPPSAGEMTPSGRKQAWRSSYFAAPSLEHKETMDQGCQTDPIADIPPVAALSASTSVEESRRTSQASSQTFGVLHPDQVAGLRSSVLTITPKAAEVQSGPVYLKAISTNVAPQKRASNISEMTSNTSTSSVVSDDAFKLREAPVIHMPGPPNMPPPSHLISPRQTSSKVSNLGPRPPRPTSPAPADLLQRAQTPISDVLNSPFAGTPSYGTLKGRDTVRSGKSTRRGKASSFLSGQDSLHSRAGSIDSAHTSDGGFQMEKEPMSNHGMNSTDPDIIHAITQTMIGEYMYKYTRRVMGGGISEKRHRRFFWIHPYNRTLYWSAQDPGSAKANQSASKGVYIAAARQVVDSNQQPVGLPYYSIILTTPDRDIKITAPSLERHQLWFSAINYLLDRSSDIAPIGKDDSPRSIAATSGIKRKMSTPSLAGRDKKSGMYSQSSQSESHLLSSKPKSRMSTSTLVQRRPKTPGADYQAVLGSPRSVRSYAASTLHSFDTAEYADIDETEYVEDDEDEDRPEGYEGLENVRVCCGEHNVAHLAHKKHQHQHRRSHSKSSSMMGTRSRPLSPNAGDGQSLKSASTRSRAQSKQSMGSLFQP